MFIPLTIAVIVYYVILLLILCMTEGEAFEDLTSKELKIVLYPFGFILLCFLYIKKEINKREQEELKEKEEKSEKGVDNKPHHW